MSVVGLSFFANGWASSNDLVDSVAAGAVGAVGDPRATRIVYAMVIGLALVGLLFIWLGIWVVRQTRVDREMLAPLERMGDRDWRKSDPASQRRSLDEVRPPDAEPLQPEPHRPRIDSEFEQADRPVQSFDDLDSISPEGADPTPAGHASDALDKAEAESDGAEPDELEAGEADSDEIEAAESDDTEVDAEPETGGSESEDDDVEADGSESDGAEPDAGEAESGGVEPDEAEAESEADGSESEAVEPDSGEPEPDGADPNEAELEVDPSEPESDESKAELEESAPEEVAAEPSDEEPAQRVDQ